MRKYAMKSIHILQKDENIYLLYDEGLEYINQIFYENTSWSELK